jgi:hypothetical protein
MGSTIKVTGSYKEIYRYLNNLAKMDLNALLAPFGQKGIDALIAHTPRESGLAAESWYYTIRKGKRGVTLEWHNRDIENGFPVAIMLQYGYGTGTGGYVHGQDYINPAMRPIFEEIANEVSKVVKSA